MSNPKWFGMLIISLYSYGALGEDFHMLIRVWMIMGKDH